MESNIEAGQFTVVTLIVNARIRVRQIRTGETCSHGEVRPGPGTTAASTTASATYVVDGDEPGNGRTDHLAQHGDDHDHHLDDQATTSTPAALPRPPRHDHDDHDHDHDDHGHDHDDRRPRPRRTTTPTTTTTGTTTTPTSTTTTGTTTTHELTHDDHDPGGR